MDVESKSRVDDRATCGHCGKQKKLDFDFTMAFQPIINYSQRRIFGYEALVRGLNNESAYSVISRLNEDNLYVFDQLCRIKAIALAAKLQLDSILSINFTPNAVYQPQRCIRTTLEAAKKYNFPINKIMFEFNEGEKIRDSEHVRGILEYYDKQGFITAIDDFGAGHSGLGLLADFQTNIVKLDMGLIRGIDTDKVRQSIVRNCVNMFRDLDIQPLAEGVETLEEAKWLFNVGIDLMQGFFFARPGFECLPVVDFSYQ
jgi:EAL domain-containing protein (putative c-di-GMP-specific phosphodiesterase class I)